MNKVFAFALSVLLAASAGASEIRSCIIHPKAVGVCPATVAIDPTKDSTTFSILYQARVDNPLTSILWGLSMLNNPAKDKPRGCAAGFTVRTSPRFTLTNATSPVNTECTPWNVQQVNGPDNTRDTTTTIIRRFHTLTPPNPAASLYNWEFSFDDCDTGTPGTGAEIPVASDTANWWNLMTNQYSLDANGLANGTFFPMPIVTAGYNGVDNTTASCTAQSDQISTPATPIIYVCTDIDNDNICDLVDNCPYVSNANQLDSNTDGRGNACQCGDANNDGTVSVQDIVAVNGCIFTPGTCSKLADADGNGIINVSDVVAINLETFSQGATATCRMPAQHNGLPAGLNLAPCAIIAPCPGTGNSCTPAACAQ